MSATFVDGQDSDPTNVDERLRTRLAKLAFELVAVEITEADEFDSQDFGLSLFGIDHN